MSPLRTQDMIIAALGLQVIMPSGGGGIVEKSTSASINIFKISQGT